MIFEGAMRSGVLKADMREADGTTRAATPAAGDGTVPAAGRSAEVVEFAPPPGPVEPPLPLVDGVPAFRVDRAMVGGLALLGDAAAMAAVWLGSLALGLPGGPVLGGAAALLLAGWVLGQYGRFAADAGWPGAACMAVAGGLGALAMGLRADGIAVATAVAWLGGAAGVFGLWRAVLGGAVARWRRDGMFARRVAVLGGAGSEPLVELLRRDGAAAGLVLAGVYEDRPGDLPAGRLRWPELWRDAGQGRVDAVVVALPWAEPGAVTEACRALRGLLVDVWLLAPAESPAAAAGGAGLLPGAGLLAVDMRPLTGWRAVAKRAEDLVLGTVLTLAFAPVMVMVALVVAADSRGPVLLRQRRFGLGNAPILVYKFRTMFHDKGDTTGARATVPGDSRVTRVGRFLRASSLDELPQLFNVLAGDMSLVGPRPHPVEMNIKGRMYHLIAPDYAARHRMKPGITGLAQISGFRGLVDTAGKAHGRLALDLRYIREWSVGMDLRILARTVAKGFFGSGAF